MAQFPVENTQGGTQDIGEIKAFMRTSAPYGYLKCDGTTYNIGDYPELETLFTSDFGAVNYFGGDGTTTFAVPDLRGEFLRGTGTNSHNSANPNVKEGSGASVGVHQGASVIERAYTIESSGGGWIAQRSQYNGYNYDASIGNIVGLNNSEGTATASIAGSTFTARPTNTSVLYCIRAY